ncbi:MAG TPA: energy transducer TonB [Pyrinomonadaceae bacterium]|jgi:TonB family protein|nr:energy transducer TonB [Pyrinomonadaceae bacterium]
MPLNVRRFYSLVVLVLGSFFSFAHAQVVTPSPSPTEPQQAAQLPPAPTSGDVMRDRITKAKAFIAVRNYNAAIYELENIRKESADQALQGVVNVLLMNSYLEQGDYTRGQNFLKQLFNEQKTTKPNALAAYNAVAGQVVKGARNRAERYKALGLNVGDRMLPLEALNDLEKMRETLELVITESKEIGQTPAKTADAMALLEEATSSRSMLARDDYDAKRWRDEVADTREQMTNARSVVMSAVTQDGVNSDAVAANTPNTDPNAATRQRSVGNGGTPSDSTVAMTDKPVYVPTSVPTKIEPQQVIQTQGAQPAPTKTETAKADEPKADLAKTDTPLDVGSSLMAYATRQTPPVYPPAARTMRTTGIVRVDVTVNETGDVTDVSKTSGPSLLQGAAQDAIKKWKFKPFTRGGQPVKANGYVNFNFNL